MQLNIFYNDTFYFQALGLNVDLGVGLSLAGGHLSTQQALTSVTIPPRSTAVIPPNQEQLTNTVSPKLF